MGFIFNLFNLFLYQPLFNILVFLYNIIPGHDFGIAIIILTVLIKFLLYPLGSKAIKSQKVFSELQPKVKELQDKYKDNKEKQAQELMALYKREKINPFAGLLPVAIQIPVLIALYKIFWTGLKNDQMNLLYSFNSAPNVINSGFLGIADLSQPNIYLAILAGVSQYFQVKMVNSASAVKPAKNDSSAMIQKQMQFFLPFLTVIILFKMPSAVGLYWLITNLFTIFQQYLLFKKKPLTSVELKKPA